MTSPTDSDLDRLREEHQLDLTDVRTKADLEDAFRKTAGKAGSKFDASAQEKMREQLVQHSDKWYGLPTIQERVSGNIESEIDRLIEEESFVEAQEVEVPADLSPTRKGSITRKVTQARRRQSGIETYERLVDSPEDAPFFTAPGQIKTAYGVDQGEAEELLSRIREVRTVG